MFNLKLANHCFTIENIYPSIRRMCADYIVSTPGERIRVSEAEINAEIPTDEQEREWPPSYLETLAVYRKICEHLISDNIVLFHASALAVDGKAYLFTAPSGTGKSTHTRLWRECLGERVTMINDDKPLLEIAENRVTVFGTPYAGKERIQTNTSAPVAGIIFLHQAKENTIERIDPSKAYPLLLNQTHRPADPQKLIQTMNLVGKLAKLPVYEMGCNISMEAAQLAYQFLTGEE